MNQKVCTRCNETKAAADYFKNFEKKDGLRAECKRCNKDKVAPGKRTTVKKPKLTVFDLDPATGNPYMSVETAETLFYKHVHSQKWLWLADIVGLEDLKQEAMVKMCKVHFKPEMSSAKTFFYTCMISFMGNQSKSLKAGVRKDRWRIVEDFPISNVDPDSPMATDTFGVDDVTPEDYLLAEQVLADLDSENMLRMAKGKRVKLCPDGYDGQRNSPNRNQNREAIGKDKK